MLQFTKRTSRKDSACHRPGDDKTKNPKYVLKESEWEQLVSDMIFYNRCKKKMCFSEALQKYCNSFGLDPTPEEEEESWQYFENMLHDLPIVTSDAVESLLCTVFRNRHNDIIKQESPRSTGKSVNALDRALQDCYGRGRNRTATSIEDEWFLTDRYQSTVRNDPCCDVYDVAKRWAFRATEFNKM